MRQRILRRDRHDTPPPAPPYSRPPEPRRSRSPLLRTHCPSPEVCPSTPPQRHRHAHRQAQLGLKPKPKLTVPALGLAPAGSAFSPAPAPFSREKRLQSIKHLASGIVPNTLAPPVYKSSLADGTQE